MRYPMIKWDKREGDCLSSPGEKASTTPLMLLDKGKRLLFYFVFVINPMFYIITLYVVPMCFRFVWSILLSFGFIYQQRTMLLAITMKLVLQLLLMCPLH